MTTIQYYNFTSDLPHYSFAKLQRRQWRRWVKQLIDECLG